MATDLALETGNAFLDSLPVESLARLRPHLSQLHLPSGLMLGRAGDPITAAYFPIRSVISALTVFADGHSVEVGLTGRDGLTGFPMIFGTLHMPHLLIAQVPDGAYRVEATTFATLLAEDAALHERVLAYAGYAFGAATQFAACNRLHPAEERFARWILMASDRAASDDFSLTQEFAAEMLGVRRSSVSIVAGVMQRSGVIRYVRGAVTVLDREALEGIACECYAATEASLRAYMGYDLSRS